MTIMYRDYFTRAIKTTFDSVKALIEPNYINRAFDNTYQVSNMASFQDRYQVSRVVTVPTETFDDVLQNEPIMKKLFESGFGTLNEYETYFNILLRYYEGFEILSLHVNLPVHADVSPLGTACFNSDLDEINIVKVLGGPESYDSVYINTACFVTASIETIFADINIYNSIGTKLLPRSRYQLEVRAITGLDQFTDRYSGLTFTGTPSDNSSGPYNPDLPEKPTGDVPNIPQSEQKPDQPKTRQKYTKKKDNQKKDPKSKKITFNKGLLSLVSGTVLYEHIVNSPDRYRNLKSIILESTSQLKSEVKRNSDQINFKVIDNASKQSAEFNFKLQQLNEKVDSIVYKVIQDTSVTNELRSDIIQLRSAQSSNFVTLNFQQLLLLNSITSAKYASLVVNNPGPIFSPLINQG